MDSSNNMDISNNTVNTSQPMDIEHTFNIALNDLVNTQNVALQVEAAENNESDTISSYVAESAIDFIRNLLRTRIIDISENQSYSLNLPPSDPHGHDLLLAGRTINFNHIFSRNGRGILARSFEEDKCKYKKVLSEKGTEDIQYIEYTPDKFEDQEKCVFTMRSFEVGDIVAKLPCEHIFDKDSILKWLKEEKASCPVCRYELDAKEVENKKEEEVDASAINQNVIQNIEFIQHPIRFNRTQYRPSRNRNIFQLMNLIEREQDAREEEELQQAILASLQDISGN